MAGSGDIQPRQSALIVGVDRYQDPEIRTLEFAENDATELFGFFKHVAGYHRVELLRSPTSEQVLDRAVELISELTPDDCFLFYFAGHGVEHMGRHLLLCPNARLSRLQYMQQVIPLDLFREETNRPGIARIFILDACRTNLTRTRSGTQEGFRGVQSLRDVVASSKPGSSPLAILCSCSEGQHAGEIASRRQGLFTVALLDTFQEATRAGRPLTLSDELESALLARMQTLAAEAGLQGGQQPWIQRSGVPPVLFHARAAGKGSDTRAIKQALHGVSQPSMARPRALTKKTLPQDTIDAPSILRKPRKPVPSASVPSWDGWPGTGGGVGKQNPIPSATVPDWKVWSKEHGGYLWQQHSFPDNWPGTVFISTVMFVVPGVAAALCWAFSYWRLKAKYRLACATCCATAGDYPQGAGLMDDCPASWFAGIDKGAAGAIVARLGDLALQNNDILYARSLYTQAAGKWGSRIAAEKLKGLGIG